MKINNDTKEVIENNDMELTDEELDNVSGGCGGDEGDNRECSWNPNGSGKHEWELIDGKLKCKHCLVYMQ